MLITESQRTYTGRHLRQKVKMKAIASFPWDLLIARGWTRPFGDMYLKTKCGKQPKYKHLFNSLSSGTTRRESRYQKPLWISLKQETVSGSGISWAICKSAPRSRQITPPVS